MRMLAAVLSAVAATWSSTGHRRSSTKRAALASPPASAALLILGAVVTMCVGWRLLRLSFWMLCALGVAATITSIAIRGRQRQRRRVAVAADVVTLCLALAAELRTGRMPDDALASAVAQLGPLADGMTGVARAAAHGAQIDAELQTLAESMSSARLSAVASVWLAAAATGARVADVLERLAVAFAAEDEAATDLEAVAAGPRATAAVLSLLPVVGVALAVAIGAHPFRVLLHTGVGALLLIGAALLDAVGVWSVRHITLRALRA